jgi:hypothetical protein
MRHSDFTLQVYLVWTPGIWVKNRLKIWALKYPFQQFFLLLYQCTL